MRSPGCERFFQHSRSPPQNSWPSQARKTALNPIPSKCRRRLLITSVDFWLSSGGRLARPN
jgi:hypothetical protein